MEFSLEIDKDDGQILSAYLKVADGKVRRTVEMKEGVCYADEDARGRLLGLELLAPASVRVQLRSAARRYGVPALAKAAGALGELLRAA